MPRPRATASRLPPATSALLLLSVSQETLQERGPVDKFLIEGGRRLEGSVEISGAKNAALPALAATLLTSETVRLENVPRVHDISTMARLLAHIHVEVALPNAPDPVVLRAVRLNHAEAPYELVKTMR